MPLIAEIQAATDLYYAVKKPIDMFFKANVLFYTLMQRGTTYDGGKKIQCNLEIAMSDAGSYGPKSELPITKREVMTAAFFTYAAYFATMTVDMEDDVMVPYGEITQNELPVWQAKVDATAQTMNFKFMQGFRRLAGTDVTEESKPDLYISTEVLKDAFENSLQAQQRFQSGALIRAGFENVLFKGSPVVADGKCADKSIYALNTRFLDVKTHTKRNFTKPEWKSPVRQPDLATANIRWAGQLVCSNRAAHALATNVTPAA
jgi:hypothetical protein